MSQVQVQEFFDQDTNTVSYVVFDRETRDGVVIDPVWDFQPADGTLTNSSLLKIQRYITNQELRIHYILETHPHADHVTGAQWLKAKLSGSKVAIGEGISAVQKVFKKMLNLEDEFPTDGSQFDLLLKDGATYHAGSLSIEVISTPGHTPACCCLKIGENLFTGDVLFMPDNGTGRCDFPLGSAEELFDSIQRLYLLDSSTNIYPAHDYPKDREVRFRTTIEEQKRSNIHVPAGRSREEFVKFRTERDRQLTAPRLLFPSIQINIRAGHLPPPESNGAQYLKHSYDL
jgi:glyoxylase-like metal-dependent hydrolase (beta-lactamase superfamily II)